MYPYLFFCSITSITLGLSPIDYPIIVHLLSIDALDLSNIQPSGHSGCAEREEGGHLQGLLIGGLVPPEFDGWKVPYANANNIFHQKAH